MRTEVGGGGAGWLEADRLAVSESVDTGDLLLLMGLVLRVAPPGFSNRAPL